MNNKTPSNQIAAIAVTANRDRHKVLVELGKQTLALAPEAAHALSDALSVAATALAPIAAERPKIDPLPVPVNQAADLLINTISVLVDRYRTGTLSTPSGGLVPAAMALPATVELQGGGASISAPVVSAPRD